MRRRALNESTRPVALHAGDHVVAIAVDAFGYNPKAVIFHDGRAADTPEQALLHSALELDDRDSRTWLRTRIRDQRMYGKHVRC